MMPVPRQRQRIQQRLLASSPASAGSAGRGQLCDAVDHDLGGDDTIWPVIEVLERAAFDERPFDIGVVYIHSANPPNAAKLIQALRHWGYNERFAVGSPTVGYLGGGE